MGGRAQTEAIIQKAKSISDAIIRTKTTRSKTRTLYKLIFRPAIEYTLVQPLIPPANLAIIEIKLLRRIYKMWTQQENIQSNTTRTYRPWWRWIYFPRDHSGYVTHFLKHWQTKNKDNADRLLGVVMTWQQYQAETSFPILKNTGYKLDYVQEKYIPAVQNYLHIIQATIGIQPNSIPSPLWQNDKIIMEIESQLQMTQK